MITFLRGDEVDVTVTEGATGSRVPTDSYGREALELGERVEELAIGDFGMKVSDVKRRRRGGDRLRYRH